MLDQIDADLKSAMLNQDTVTVSVLRMLKGALQNQAIENKGTLNDDDVLAVLKREVKKRKEAAELYTQAGDELRSSTELAEAEIIQKYLPEQMSEAAVAQIVAETIAELNTDNMGQIMGAVMGKVQGQADGGLVSKLVREKLQG